MREKENLANAREPKAYRERNRRYWWNHREKQLERTRLVRLKKLAKRFGVSPEFLVGILEKQGQSCAICKKKFDQSVLSSRAVLDHDHETDEIRGYLCNSCNIAIGCFQESLEFIESAAAYLKRGRGGADGR
jgi:hypothetical protein